MEGVTALMSALRSLGCGKKVRVPLPYPSSYCLGDQVFQILNSVFTTEYHVALGMLFNFSEPQFYFLEKYLVGQSERLNQGHDVRRPLEVIGLSVQL